MVAIELTENDAMMLREMLEVQARDLRHEIHHTDDRTFRQLLKQRELMLEHVLGQLPALSASPA